MSEDRFDPSANFDSHQQWLIPQGWGCQRCGVSKDGCYYGPCMPIASGGEFHLTEIQRVQSRDWTGSQNGVDPGIPDTTRRYLNKPEHRTYFEIWREAPWE